MTAFGNPARNEEEKGHEMVASKKGGGAGGGGGKNVAFNTPNSAEKEIQVPQLKTLANRRRKTSRRLFVFMSVTFVLFSLALLGAVIALAVIYARRPLQLGKPIVVKLTDSDRHTVTQTSQINFEEKCITMHSNKTANMDETQILMAYKAVRHQLIATLKALAVLIELFSILQQFAAYLDLTKGECYLQRLLDTFDEDADSLESYENRTIKMTAQNYAKSKCTLEKDLVDYLADSRLTKHCQGHSMYFIYPYNSSMTAKNETSPVNQTDCSSIPCSSGFTLFICDSSTSQ